MNYYSLNQYNLDRFGTKAYKISLDGGFTCPNRDGTLDTRGCIFCSASGSGDFTPPSRLSISEQIERGKALVERKTQGKNAKYIAYFQAFTSTYDDVTTLERLYLEAMRPEDVLALSIATRPDCLGPEVLRLLEKMRAIKPVWVELGLQTIHPATAAYIRRCYPLKVYDEAAAHLSEIGIGQIITHVILGLPHETKEMMLQTVDYVAKSPSNGIKLQLLHVLRNTDLAREYEQGRFDVLSMEEYTDLVVDAIRLLPPDMVVHRLTGDGRRRDLIAPLWSLEKWKVLNMIRCKLEKDRRLLR